MCLNKTLEIVIVIKRKFPFNTNHFTSIQKCTKSPLLYEPYTINSFIRIVDNIINHSAYILLSILGTNRIYPKQAVAIGMSVYSIK